MTPHTPAADALDTPGQAGPLRFAGMTGSSIAGRDAAPWVTDFLNAAYYRRPAASATSTTCAWPSAILTTYWYRAAAGAACASTDVVPFHRAFGARPLRRPTARRRGTLEPRASCSTAPRGCSASGSPAPTPTTRAAGWGIAFPTVDERAAYDPSVGWRSPRLGPLTPESAPPAEQVWHTYPPVEMPSADAVIARARPRPRRGPTTPASSAASRRCAPGGLAGQTFEIEVAAGTDTGRPVYTRGYVTITQLVTPDDPEALGEWFDDARGRAWRATARTSRASCPRAPRRSSAST